MNIGDEIEVIIDRPVGSYHPDYKNLYYPINYGYVEGIIAHDGEEQDVYLLGIKEPIDKYKATIIAVIHRLNDVEDKWVAAPKGLTFSIEEIRTLTYFQEQYFEIEIITG